MQLRKIVKKGAVAALALFAAVAIVSCSSPSGSDSGDDGKKNEQQQQQNGGGKETQKSELKTKEETKEVETSGTLDAEPSLTSNSYIMVDSTGGEYQFTYTVSVPLSSQVRSAESSVSIKGYWKYEKDGKTLYQGSFTGSSFADLKLTITQAANPLGELKPVDEKKTFDLTVDMKTGKFQATIPSVTVPLTKINVWSFTDEVPSIIEKYIETHPDCGFTVGVTIVSTNKGQYQPALNTALENNEVDIFAVEQAFALEYTRSYREIYAAPYKDFGIDIDNKIKAADIAQYTVDIGSNSDGDVVGLCYQTSGSCFIYNRTVAKSVFGTDDPTEIQTEIGGGSGKWNQFWEAAAKCADKGVAIVSGEGDIWRAYAASTEKSWIDAKCGFYIDPMREEFLDVAKNLTDKGWSNQSVQWEESWYTDMAELGPKKVLGFMGPAWFINFTMPGNSGGNKVGEGTYGDWAVCEAPASYHWGGTWILGSKNASKDAAKKTAVKQVLEWITLDTSNDGLLYKWANGTVNGEGGTKDTVASAVVMKKASGKLDFLGGQDMNPYFIKADKAANGKLLTSWDETINNYWLKHVRAYAAGEKSRDQAIADFKADISNEFGLILD